MALWQKLLLGLLFAGMIWIIVATWGSLGSAVMALCLIYACSALLCRRFLLREDDSDYYE